MTFRPLEVDMSVLWSVVPASLSRKLQWRIMCLAVCECDRSYMPGRWRPGPAVAVNYAQKLSLVCICIARVLSAFVGPTCMSNLFLFESSVSYAGWDYGRECYDIFPTGLAISQQNGSWSTCLFDVVMSYVFSNFLRTFLLLPFMAEAVGVVGLPDHDASREHKPCYQNEDIIVGAPYFLALHHLLSAYTAHSISHPRRSFARIECELKRGRRENIVRIVVPLHNTA